MNEKNKGDTDVRPLKAPVDNPLCTHKTERGRKKGRGTGGGRKDSREERVHMYMEKKGSRMMEGGKKNRVRRMCGEQITLCIVGSFFGIHEVQYK